MSEGPENKSFSGAFPGTFPKDFNSPIDAGISFSLLIVVLDSMKASHPLQNIKYGKLRSRCPPTQFQCFPPSGSHPFKLGENSSTEELGHESLSLTMDRVFTRCFLCAYPTPPILTFLIRSSEEKV